MEKGAMIERGYIASVETGGYCVASCDRAGIQTPPIQPINGNTYTTGDLVYFFLFPDGTGKILCGA